MTANPHAWNLSHYGRNRDCGRESVRSRRPLQPLKPSERHKDLDKEWQSWAFLHRHVLPWSSHHPGLLKSFARLNAAFHLVPLPRKA